MTKWMQKASGPRMVRPLALAFAAFTVSAIANISNCAKTLKDFIRRLVGHRAYNFAYRLKKGPLSLRYYLYLWYRVRRPDVFAQPSVQRIVSMFYFSRGILDWHADSARERLFAFPLDQQSVVVDVGGYVGIWSEEIVKRYDPRVIIFEPLPRFVHVLREKFSSHPKVTVVPFGLSKQDQAVNFGIREQSSGSGAKGGETEVVQLRKASSALSELCLDRIDLISMNIEGGEYDVLSELIDSGAIRKCKHVQVQFHEWHPDFKQSHLLRQQLTRALAQTHRLMYCYPFVWEAWERQ